jgi:tripartite-type tricarboxylate transporter receptor subunit TctC
MNDCPAAKADLGPPTRRWFCRAALAFSAVGVLGVPLSQVGRAQQGYPSRPVRLILAFGAGGVADITARILAEKLGEKLSQRFVVENQPGPGGIAAARTVLSAAADGHTLALITNGTAISVAAYNALPFDPVKQFVPISALGTFELVFASNVESPFKTLGDFIKAAREQPGKLNVGTINVGGTQNLAAELFKSSAALNFQIIPYRGTPEVIVALLRNDVQLMVDFYAPMKGTLVDNKIRAVATSGAARLSYLPAVSTVAESGVAGYEATAWNGIFAPAGTPGEVLDILNKAMREALAIPEVKARYAELGVEARASAPDEVLGRLKNDIVKWGAVIEKAGIRKQ